MPEEGRKRKQKSHQSNSRKEETHHYLSLLYKLLRNLANITHPRDVLSAALITELAGDWPDPARPPARALQAAPGRCLPRSAYCGCLECGNGNLPCQLLTATYSIAAGTRQPLEFPHEELRANRRAPKEDCFASSPFGGGKKKRTPYSPDTWSE